MSETLTLAACPVGLFLCGDELCLKTEYGNNEGRIDAYIVSSGEFFWGEAPQTIASQRAQLVTPVDDPRSELSRLRAEVEALKKDLRRAEERDSGGYAPDGKTWKRAVMDEAAKRAEAEARAIAAQQALAQAREALEPFAKSAELAEHDEADDYTLYGSSARHSITLGDIRRAARVYAPSEPVNASEGQR